MAKNDGFKYRENSPTLGGHIFKPPSRYPSASWDLGPDPFCVLGPGIMAFFELGPGPGFLKILDFRKSGIFENLGPGTGPLLDPGTWDYGLFRAGTWAPTPF